MFTTHLSVGRSGDVVATFSSIFANNVVDRCGLHVPADAAPADAPSVFASFGGGPSLQPIDAWQCGVEVTALKGSVGDSPGLVAVGARRARHGKRTLPEIREFGVFAQPSAATVAAPSPLVRPKPKKFFRKSDAGEEQFRASCRRGGPGGR